MKRAFKPNPKNKAEKKAQTRIIKADKKANIEMKIFLENN